MCVCVESKLYMKSDIYNEVKGQKRKPLAAVAVCQLRAHAWAKTNKLNRGS